MKKNSYARLARRVYFSSGHSYILEAFVDGPINPETGMILNLRDLDHVLKEVIDPLDHHHLNFDVEAFKETVPTTENIAKYCFEEIVKKLKLQNVQLFKVRLYEGEDLWVDYGLEHSLAN